MLAILLSSSPSRSRRPAASLPSRPLVKTFQSSKPSRRIHLLCRNKKESQAHLWQVHIRDNDLVQRARSVSPALAWVAAGVVLVRALTTVFGPGLRAVNLGHGLLGRRRRGVAAEVPAGEAKGAGHDGEQDLWVRVKGQRGRGTVGCERRRGDENEEIWGAAGRHARRARDPASRPWPICSCRLRGRRLMRRFLLLPLGRLNAEDEWRGRRRGR